MRHLWMLSIVLYIFPISAKEGNRLSLEEVIDLGMSQSLELKAQHMGVATAEAKFKQAQWGWTPKFEWTSTLAPMPKMALDQADFEVLDAMDRWGIFTKHKLKMVIPVFTFSKLSTAQDLAQIGVDVETLKFNALKFKVQYEIAKAYYGLQLAHAVAKVLRDADKKLKKAQKILDEHLKKNKGDVDETDRYQLEMAQSEFQRKVIQIDHLTQLAEDGLRIHTGLQGKIEIEKMNFRLREVQFKTLDEIWTLAQKYRLDLQMLDRAIQAREKKWALEKLGWFPDLFIGAEVGLAYSNATPEMPEDLKKLEFYMYDPYNTFGFGVLLGLKWKIDPVQKVYRIREASSALEKIKYQRALALKAARLEIEKAYLDTRAAYEDVFLLHQSKRAAKKRMTQLYADYDISGGSVDKLVRAVSAYFQLRVDYLRALHDYRLSLYQLKWVTGVPKIDLFYENSQ